MGSRLINCVQLPNKNVFFGSCNQLEESANLKVLDIRSETLMLLQSTKMAKVYEVSCLLCQPLQPVHALSRFGNAKLNILLLVIVGECIRF